MGDTSASDPAARLREAVTDYYAHLNAVAPLYRAVREAARAAHRAGVTIRDIAMIGRVTPEEAKRWTGPPP